MALDDALGDGNAALRDSLLRQYQQGDPKFTTDAGVLNDRLARKLTPLVSGGLTTPADTSPPVAPPTPQPEKAPDLSRFGTPVESAPEPSTADLSKFGTPVAEPAPVAPATLGIGGNLLAAGKGLLRGAPEAVGGIVQGIATAQPTQPIAPKGSALIDQLANASQMSTSQRAILMGQAMRAIGDRGLQIDFNAALQRIARGGDAQAEADTLRAKVAAQNAAAAGPITEQAKYKTGTAIKDAIDQLVPMTDQEKASAGGRLGTMASGIAPYAAATLAGGPAIGMAAGFTGMAADAYGQVYNDAKAKGARDDVATNAARKSALVAGVLGSLPLGAGKYAQSLIAKVASSSAAFATAGEAQEAILQQIAKDYDPKAGYSFDQKRLIAELILGAGLGGLHHAVGDHQEEPTQPAVETSQQPPVGELPKGAASARPDTGPDATAVGADVPPPGPDTGSPGAANTGDQPQQVPPPSASEPARPGKSQDFVMDPQTRSKMERVMRHIDPTSDVGKMSDADVFNTLQEHLRAGSKGRPETSDEIDARQEAATTRIERDGLIRRGWDSVWVDAMTPQQRREAFQEAMAGGPETPPRPATGVATPPKTDHETLLDAGFSEQEIADMSPRARAQRLEELKPPTSESDVATNKPVTEQTPPEPAVEPETGKRDAPVVATTVDDVLKASDVAKEPTPAQAAAQNYQHRHLELPNLGLEGSTGISIETGVGQMRRGVGADGTPWEVRMPVAYGRIKSTTGNDNEPIDIFIGPRPLSPHVFIVNQSDPATDKLDEHKVLAGFDDPKSAVQAYLDSYSDDAMPRIGNVIAMTPDQFKDWLHNDDKTKIAEVDHGNAESGTGEKDAEVTAAHQRAIEDVLGPMADKVQPVDIARAAELLAEHPNMPPGIAFQHAVIQNAVNQGDLTAAQAEEAYGPQVTNVLRVGPHTEEGGAELGASGREAHIAPDKIAIEHAAHHKSQRTFPSGEKAAEKTGVSAPSMSPEKQTAIEDAVRTMIKSILGDHVKIEFNNGLMQLGGKSSERWGKLSDNAQASGLYHPYRHLIRLALTDGITSTAFHEAYHASEYQLQTPQERALMDRETPAIRRWIAKRRGYSNEEVKGLAPEEVRAIGAEEYMKDRVNGTRNPGAGVHVGIRRWWNKVWKALRSLANKLRGFGFKTFREVYRDLYEGRHADRAGGTPRKEADTRDPETFEEGLRKAESEHEMVLGSFGDPSKVIRTFKNFWSETFQPELVSDRALLADPLFARYKSSQAQEKDALIHQSESEWNYWNKKSDAQRIRFLDDLETGRVPADAREAAMAKRYRAMLDENWKLEKQYGSQAAFIEDYFPHIWERPDDWRVFAEARSAQLGPRWFQKKRTFDFIADGLAAGLKLKYTNPVDIVVHRLSSGVDMRQRMDLLHQLKEQGLAWEGVQGGDMLVKRGWRLINAPDRKQWVIAPDVQPLWKNAVDAKGLWQAEHLGGSIFRGWMALKNAWVPVKLAMSAFHPLHVLHINYSNGMAQGWDQLVKGRDPMEALKSVGGGFVGPLVAAPGATTGAVAGALLGSTVGMPVWGGIAGSMAGAVTFGALKRAGFAQDLRHQGIAGKAAWQKRPNKQTPEEKAIVALMNDGGFVPQLSEQMKIGAQRSLAVAFQKALRKEATPGDWKRIVTAGMRRGIEKLQAPIFEQWIPALKTAAYLNQAAALVKRRPELLTYHNDRRVALRAIAKSIDNRFGEMFYGNLFWNRYLKDASIASFLSLGWNTGFIREFGGAVAESVTRPAGLLPPFKPNDSRRTIREATNKIPFAIAYMASSALILGMMSMLMDDDHKPPEGLDWIFPRIGGTNPDGSPRRITNMSYIREVPMLMKHIQERGGNALTGAADMLWNKLMFEPFKELMNNRDYYGYNIWDENAPIYKQIWQGLRHVWRDQSPITLAGAKRAAELSGKEFPSLTDAVTHPDELLGALKAKGVDLSMLGFGPAPAYVEKSSIQNRIGYLYQQHVAPASRPHADEENSEEKMAIRTAIMIAKRDHDSEMMQAARQRGRAIGLTPKYLAQIGRVPTDIYLFSRLPADDQKSILTRATPEENARYFKHARDSVRRGLRAMAR